MATEDLRVGILGVAGISSKAAVAISSPDSGCVVRGVASRSLDKAQAFVKEFFEDKAGIQAFGGHNGYEGLIASNSVDAIYIPLPTAVKKSWVIKALVSGKHVVLEKPAALTADDYEDMLAAAYANRKFILDGTMFPHHKRTNDVLVAIANESKVGKVDRIECNFSFNGGEGFDDTNVRASKGGDPLGCIGDLGWYCIRYALMVFGELGSVYKTSRVVDFKLNKHGVPVDATCVVHFDGGKVLWFHCGFRTGFRQRFEICGSKKFLSIDDLVLPADEPTNYELCSSSLTKYDLITCHERESVETEPGPVQEVLLWKKFGEICRTLDNDSSSVIDGGWAGDEQLVKEANEWAAISLLNQKVVDSLVDSIAGQASHLV